ncbi:hypothetical protein [Flagellimonas meridianipacifica]|uniref:DUF4870 domain-containing protein n=1 Tax=Flagellimonas meridianipacifica TaxID=1080225 RepID=A0A2T0MC83_9FLAO|nr:hypothetical protein [Allomuricauda pacifica]PRX55114.1 hypothetical protein CLV81_3520 [Allomuricauda pacifica]
MTTEKEGRTTASVAYLTIVGSLIALTMNMEPKNTFARFHIRQAFGIHLLYHGLAIVLTFAGIVQVSFWLFIAYIILALYGMLGALNQQRQSIPVIGPYFQKWFTFIS